MQSQIWEGVAVVASDQHAQRHAPLHQLCSAVSFKYQSCKAHSDLTMAVWTDHSLPVYQMFPPLIPLTANLWKMIAYWKGRAMVSSKGGESVSHPASVRLSLKCRFFFFFTSFSARGRAGRRQTCRGWGGQRRRRWGSCKVGKHCRQADVKSVLLLCQTPLTSNWNIWRRFLRQALLLARCRFSKKQNSQHTLAATLPLILILEVSHLFLQLVQFTPQVPSTIMYFYSTIQTQGNSKCFTRVFRVTQEDISIQHPSTFKKKS